MADGTELLTETSLKCSADDLADGTWCGRPAVAWRSVRGRRADVAVDWSLCRIHCYGPVTIRDRAYDDAELLPAAPIRGW